MNNNFPFNLKHIREEKRLTQKELGSRINKSSDIISRWELGERNPSMEDVIKLSDVLNVDIKELIEGKCDNNIQESSELETLLKRYEKYLSDKDKNYIKYIIIESIKDIDNDVGDKS